MKKLGIMNGPNMDRLGRREVGIYGEMTLEVLEERVREEGERLGVEVGCYQSNHEGELIDKLRDWEAGGFYGVVINPAGYTHTSVALRDAMMGAELKFVEVHISNIHGREKFRQKYLTAEASIGVISGLGIEGYLAAMRFLS